MSDAERAEPMSIRETGRLLGMSFVSEKLTPVEDDTEELERPFSELSFTELFRLEETNA